MKNLEQYNVIELSTHELEIINGGKSIFYEWGADLHKAWNEIKCDIKEAIEDWAYEMQNHPMAERSITR